MATSAGAEFTKVFTYNGSAYTDVTLEAQSPAGTAFAILGAASHYLYLGHVSRFDMAIFDLAIVGSLGALTWEFSNGSNWTAFVPASARYETDPDDNEGGAFDFSRDGAEIFPPNMLSDWATLTVNSSNIYWIRVSTASVTAFPTVNSGCCSCSLISFAGTAC